MPEMVTSVHFLSPVFPPVSPLLFLIPLPYYHGLFLCLYLPLICLTDDLIFYAEPWLGLPSVYNSDSGG